MDKIRKVIPETVGMSSKSLSYIDDVMERAIREKVMKGMVTLVARHGKIVQFKAYGMADDNKKMKKKAIFRLASMSKTIGAVALMQLYDRGLVMPSDKVSDYIPAFKDAKKAVADDSGHMRLEPLQREITVHDLLTMTSGIASVKSAETGHPGCVFCADAYKKAGIVDTMHRLDLTLAEQVDRLSRMPLAAEPGQMWIYSNLSSLVVGRIVEIVSGMDIDSYYLKYILKPLGMTQTWFYPPREEWERIPSVYAVGSMERLDQLDLPGTDDTRLPYASECKYYNTAAGLMGTVEDYFRFAQMLCNRGVYEDHRILSPHAVDLMTKNYIGEMRTNLYGHGWGYMMEVQVEENTTFNYLGNGSYGWHGYWGSVFNVWPKEDMLAIMISQTSPVDPTWKVQERFLNVAAASVIDR